MKKIISAALLAAMLLSTAFSAVGCAKDTTDPANKTTVSTKKPDTSDDETSSAIHDVVFGRYGLVLNYTGNSGYIGNVSQKNFSYILGKTTPGQVAIMPELEAVMKDCDKDTVFAVHIMAFEKDCTVDDLKITKKSELGKMITAGIQFDGFDRYVAMGKVFFLTSDEINSLTCPADKRMICGMVAYDEIWSKDQEEFNEAVDELGADETLPVYVYYNTPTENDTTFSDEVLTNESKVVEIVEMYHNYVNSDDFAKLITDGTIQKGLEDFVKNMGITSDVIYTPHLSRLQTRMTAEQIKNLPDGYVVEIRN